MGLFSYREKRYGKTALRLFSLLVIVIGAALIYGGVMALIHHPHWTKYVISVPMFIISIFPIFIGFYMFMITFSMINSWKSVKDGNKSKGIANARLCDKCGRQITKKAEFCEHCGTKQETGLGLKSCPHCKTKNSGAAEFCEKCGEKF